MNKISSCAPPLPTQKGIQRMIGNTHNLIGKPEAGLAQQRSQHGLLQRVWRQNGLIGIVNMNQPLFERYADSSSKIQAGYEIVVTMENVIFTNLQLSPKSPNEISLLTNGEWAVDNRGTEFTNHFIHLPFLPQGAVESPIQLYSPFTSMSQHAHEPIFDRSSINVFDDVEDFQNSRLEALATFYSL
ncbi:MAG: hypothetical protein NTV80_08420 [Verrucomicrobia bacterium]|nr:hypothetical protein [Verrucomicrobiota bacterium]